MSTAGVLSDARARGFASGVAPLRYSGWNAAEGECHAFALREVVEGWRVMDVGCGTGAFARALQELKGCRVLGVEPNEDRAQAARKNGIAVHAGFLTEEMVMANGAFDAVLLMDVLEHVADPVELLDLVHRSLKSGGRLIISVPNVAHWTVRMNLALGRFSYAPAGIMDATHLRWFTRATITGVLAAAAFRIRSHEVSWGAWMPDYYLRRPWRWLNERRRKAVLKRLCRWKPDLFGCQHLITATAELSAPA